MYLIELVNIKVPDAEIEPLWEKIPKTVEKDGKVLDTVGKKALKKFVL